MSRGTLVSPVPTYGLAKRLYPNLKYNEKTGCREWTRYVCKQTGYGKIANRPGPPISIHVAVWILEVGPIPVGLLVRHDCDNRICGEISHLLLGTQGDNVKDMMERGRHVAYIHETCPLGHKHDEIAHSGHNSCSRCRLRSARLSERNKRIRRGIQVKSVCEECVFVDCKCKEFELGIFAPVRIKS